MIDLPGSSGTYRVGVGVDCERISEWRAVIGSERGEQRKGLFSAEEREYCEGFADPVLSYAGRWCAKEAVVKSLDGVVKMVPRDVTILSETSGRPVVRYSLEPDHPQVSTTVSISHDSETAIAVAVSVAVLEEVPNDRIGRLL